MFTKLFSIIGGYIGKSLGGGILSTIGRFSGKLIGNYLDQNQQQYEEQNKEVFEYYHLGKHINSLEILQQAYGNHIPLIFGIAKVHATIIWASNPRVQKNIYTINKGATVNSIHHYSNNIYHISVAMALCEGPITDIGRVWYNDNIIDISTYKYSLHKGTEEQEPDPLISSIEGENQTPAFRGLAYIVFEDIIINDFNSKIPIFTFEVIRKPYVQQEHTNNVEDLVKSIIMIPGSGEFVLDTEIQYKYLHSENGVILEKEAINCNNGDKVANSIVSLNHLLKTCNNIKWVAPVVCWFGTSLNAGECKVLPIVEYNDCFSSTSEKWQVSHYNRYTARLASKDSKGKIRYGGSINDNSIIRYLNLLKSKNLKIMFYPIVMMDIPGKAWRGYITGTADTIANFFRGGQEFSPNNPKDGSYNAFILHYATLVKGMVDAFIIGSELKGLTKVQDIYQKFPAVEELIKLADCIKSILGPQTLVSYAADWSEYHHIDTVSGYWYNLDPLWACESIDFIGIDAYFPLTKSISSDIFIDEIKQGWQSGEGYDYHINKDGSQIQYNNQRFAWKNIEYWWSNIHVDSNGKKTLWQPKMKKIWFTEFGFPSIDKATNQPNIFYDPYSSSSGIPLHSTGEIDFAIQRKAIKASLEYWQNSPMVENMFLWAWDARPYPAFPSNSYWSDGNLWESGHWVSGKFMYANLASVIIELCIKCGIDVQKIDVTSLNDNIDGLLISKNHQVIDIINMLRCCYFFDLIISNIDKVSFIKRGKKNTFTLSVNNCVNQQDYTPVNYIIVPSNQILNDINLQFIDINNNYNIAISKNSQEQESYNKPYNLCLPVVMSLSQAQNICQAILRNANAESQAFSFILPINYINLEVSDIITLEENNLTYVIRITNNMLFSVFNEN